MGEFEIDAGLQVLKQAVEIDDFKLRKAAVEGLTKLAANMKDKLDDEACSGIVAVLREPAIGKGSFAGTSRRVGVR